MRLRLRRSMIYSLLRLELFGFLQCPLLGSRNAAFNFRAYGGTGPSLLQECALSRNQAAFDLMTEKSSHFGVSALRPNRGVRKVSQTNCKMVPIQPVCGIFID